MTRKKEEKKERDFNVNRQETDSVTAKTVYYQTAATDTASLE